MRAGLQLTPSTLEIPAMFPAPNARVGLANKKRTLSPKTKGKGLIVAMTANQVVQS